MKFLYPIERGSWVNWFDATINLVNSRKWPKKNKIYIDVISMQWTYLFPEEENQVYFLQDLNVVVFVIDPMMEEFSIRQKEIIFNIWMFYSNISDILAMRTVHWTLGRSKGAWSISPGLWLIDWTFTVFEIIYGTVKLWETGLITLRIF
jgi:hypothetical protein